jgi:hypothetical protein
MKSWRVFFLATLALAAALSSASCQQAPAPPPPPPSSVWQQPCADFCGHLRTLGCPEGQPRPSGRSCEAVCVNIHEEGLDLKMACVLNLQHCADIQTQCPAAPLVR